MSPTVPGPDARSAPLGRCRAAAVLVLVCLSPGCRAPTGEGPSAAHDAGGTSGEGTSQTEGGGASGTPEDAGALPTAGSDAASAGAGGSGAPGTAGGPDGRCGRAPSEPRPCGQGLEAGYYAFMLGTSAGAFTCVAAERQSCTVEPPPFATLSECLEVCERGATPDETLCTEPGTQEPSCEPTQGAEVASLEAQTPLGPLQLTRAFLDRVQGFTNSVNVRFSSRLEARPDAVPSVHLSLPDPFDGRQHLIGSHELLATVTLCERTFQVPVLVTVTADELTSGNGERFELVVESLAPDVRLEGRAAFSEVCTYSTSI